jgi:hypothetical protein
MPLNIAAAHPDLPSKAGLLALRIKAILKVKELSVVCGAT